jgi:hypothetical protein
VEEDGDQGDGFDGVNLEGGDPFQAYPAKQLGLWRVEVEPLEPESSHRFLNILLPRLKTGGTSQPVVELVEAGAQAHAVRVGGSVLVFARRPAPVDRVSIRSRGRARCLVLDARPGALYRAGGRSVAAGGEGVLDAGRFEDTLSIELQTPTR